MSFKEFKDSLNVFAQKFSVKTEEYAKITKLNIDIKKIESDISKLYKELGKEVFMIRDSGVTELPFKGTNVSDLCDRVSDYLKQIDVKKDEIDEIRKTAHLKESEISAQTDSADDSDDGDE
ncbi:MAG: hypothetical protein JW982_05505 [Spirochaetes bacterium]|nr:hypothetical protein [Spirochaetota bacterium]